MKLKTWFLCLLFFLTYREVVVRANLSVVAGGRVNVVFIEHLVVVVVSEDAHEAATIPVVRHTTSVVDMTRSVEEHLEWELLQRRGE